MSGWHGFSLRSGKLTPWLAALVCCGVAALAWFGYRAAQAWERSSALLVERRANEIADLLATALGRDMRAVQTSILDGAGWDAMSLGETAEIKDLVAGAFARYPYPEVFFAWSGNPDTTVFFARTDRMPSWLAPNRGGTAFPVDAMREPGLARTLADRVNRDTSRGRHHALFGLTIAGQEYQVVVRALYGGAHRDIVQGGIGFLVNMPWVEAHYFSDITAQVARIARAGEGVQFTILDEHGAAIPGLPAPLTPGNPTRRVLPVLFFDPTLAIIDPPEDLRWRVWSVSVDASEDPTLVIAAVGARRTLVVVAVGALALGVGLLFTVRAARATAHIASLRSDFVSTVTHELKTPVQVIRGIGETLIRGRVQTEERLHEYAVMLVQEGHRLSRLIENLLAYSRVTDVTQFYLFEPQRPTELVDEALKGFRRLIAEGHFELQVDVPTDLPTVRADRTAFVLALDNLIDNAMRYSGESRTLAIRARADSTSLDFSVIDNGRGIPAEELPRVQQRFARGRSSKGAGSGLGLAIVNRIAADHGGVLKLTSTPDIGTTATLSLPLAEAQR